VVIDVRDGKEKFSSKQSATVGRAAWLPDGSGLLLLQFSAGGSQIWHVAYPRGETRRIPNDTNNYSGLSLTADGKALVTLSAKFSTRFWIISQGEWRHPHDISPGTSELDGLNGFSWMPDGRILYSSRPIGTGIVAQLGIGVGISGEFELWVMNPDGSDPKRFPLGVPVDGVSASELL
jgi:WD40 repeat protein